MILNWQRFFVLSLVLSSLSANARVFDINSESFAAYFKFNYSPSTLKKTTYEKVSPFGETFSGDITAIYGGEFGFVYSARYLNLRFGLEVVRPPTLAVVASNSSGTKLYDLSSEITAVIPKIGIEYNIRQWRESRLYLNGNYGLGNIGMTNSYTFTATGAASPMNGVEYTEEGRGTATLAEGSLGLETLMFDTTTLVLEAGYRQLNFTTLTHNRSATTLNGSKVKGDAMLNTDGTARTVNMTGSYAGLMFRFWIK